MTTDVEKADILVCHYREGPAYTAASRAGKDVGNLPWLYYIITNDTWTSPLRRLLHYPVARDGLPGFEQYRVALSNYGGEARLYLENLVRAAGGEFTKTMKVDNTHLITARDQSEKCEAAKEWNIHMINHLWLEESYAKWQVQSLSEPRYSHFPRRTNLGEVVGQTQMDRDVLRTCFFPDDESSSDEQEAPPSTMLHRKDHNAPSSLLGSSGARRAHKGSSAVAAMEDDASTSTPVAIRARAKRVGTGSADNEVVTPSISRSRGLGKENQTPSSNGSRSAKSRAVARLHDLAPDIALYEKEKKRVGGVVWGGRKSSEETSVGKRSFGSMSHQSANDDSDVDDGRDSKKARRAKAPPPTMKLLLTGYNRWTGQAQREEDDTASGNSFQKDSSLTDRAETASSAGDRRGDGARRMHAPGRTIDHANTEIRACSRIRAGGGLDQVRGRLSGG